MKKQNLRIDVSEAPYGLSESYEVKFWYKDENGFLKQGDEIFYSNSKSAHEDVEKFFMNEIKNFSAIFKEVRIISVTYQ